MQILLRRHAGWTGRFASMDVFVNDQKVCSIERNETKAIAIPDDGGLVRVEMQAAVSSPSVRVGPEGDGLLFECGTNWWVPFDVLSFCYLSFLKHRVFYFRPVSAEQRRLSGASGGTNGA